MQKSLKLLLVFAMAVLWGEAGAFVVGPADSKPSQTILFESRRGFMALSFGAAAASLTWGNSPALAIDDLAMPSEAEKVSSANACLNLAMLYCTVQPSPFT